MTAEVSSQNIEEFKKKEREVRELIRKALDEERVIRIAYFIDEETYSVYLIHRFYANSRYKDEELIVNIDTTDYNFCEDGEDEECFKDVDCAVEYIIDIIYDSIKEFAKQYF